MDRDELLKNVAPCGLVCYTCTACGHGIIREHARQLSHYLTGVSDFLKARHPGDSEKVAACTRVLSFYAGQDCPGCRGGETQCTLENCVIRECTAAKRLDFCAECSDFPCEKVHLPPVFTDKWRAANARIRQIGAEAYFLEEKCEPHFLRYETDARS